MSNNAFMISTQEIAIKDSRSILVVCVSDNKLIGSVQLVYFDLDNPKLQNLHVDQGYRGQGIGNMLISKAIDCCNKHDKEELEVITYASNPNVVAWYKRRGFERNMTGKDGRVNMSLSLPRNSDIPNNIFEK